METERSFLFVWTRATTLGWLLGFVLVLVFAMLSEAAGASGQWMVGAGMGGGVGFAQGRVLRRWLGAVQPWLATTMGGLALPFLAHDIGRAFGRESLYSLPLYVAIGSVLVGLLQVRLLRRHTPGAVRWLPVCVVGWCAPAALIALGDRIGGPLGSVAGLVGMLLGGTVLALLTASPLERLLTRASA